MDPVFDYYLQQQEKVMGITPMKFFELETDQKMKNKKPEFLTGSEGHKVGEG